MTDVRDAKAVKPLSGAASPSGSGSGSTARVVVPVLAALVVVAVAAYFLQHFPATLLAVALVLIALGRLAPILREAAGSRAANVYQGCFEFAGVALLALAAVQGALGEVARALAALLHG